MAVWLWVGQGDPREAWGQACCASAGLVAPTRLFSYEDLAVGVQGRGRSAFGAYDAGGGYRRSGAGETEWILEQDVFAVARFLRRGQVALLLPFIETRRTLPGIAAWGGGIGDVTASARYDFIAAGQRRLMPGVALLLAVVVPTGKAPEDAGDTALAAGATGQGSFEVSGGLAFEQAFEPYFVTLNGLVALRGGRRVAAGVTESFAPRWTALLAVGRVLPGEVTVGTFVSALAQADNRYESGTIPGSSTSLLTTGVAATLGLDDRWRLQGTAFSNVPLAGWGRNQNAGAGASLSVIRAWP